MNFELKPLGCAEISAEKCDALIVLVPEEFKAGKDSLSQLIAQVIKSGDLDTKAAKLLNLYRPAQALAVRVVLVGTGEGSARDVHKAVVAATGSVKSKTLKKLAICFAAPPSQAAVRAVVAAVSDATYVYTHTKSKPDGRTVGKVLLTAANATELRDAFE